jgi:hypothetical protein
MGISGAEEKIEVQVGGRLYRELIPPLPTAQLALEPGVIHLRPL